MGAQLPPIVEQNESWLIMNKKKTIVFWGLVWMVSYLYLFETLWAVSNVPSPCDPQHTFVYRSGPIQGPATVVRQVLWILSFPSAQQSHMWLPDEPYAKDLVYTPLASAIQWFVYGCVFGLWRYRHGVRHRASPLNQKTITSAGTG
jgi:hypothetical protein